MAAEFRNLVLENAKRLLADAEVLHGAGRYASAMALAIYALEECGKYLMEKWSDENFVVPRQIRKGYHEKKQLAISSLFTALAFQKRADPFMKHYFSEFDMTTMTREEFKEEWRKASDWLFNNHADFISNEMMADERAALMDYSKGGVLEFVKQACIHVDRYSLKKGFDHKIIKDADAQSMIENARDAIAQIDDDRMIGLARAMIEGFLENE
jgi:AbiV family abortive infection protein